MKTVFLFLSLNIFFFSSNLFAQWTPINPVPFIDNYFIVMADAEECKVITKKGNIFTSTDGGNYWEINFSKHNIFIDKIFFVNEKLGFAANNSFLYKTIDGGNSWEKLGNSPAGTSWDFFFRDSLTGWSVGNNYILSTIDGGDTWETYTVSNSSMLSFIAQLSDSILFAGGFKFYRSTDSGISWAQLPIPINLSSLRKFIAVDTLGFLLDDFNKIAKTTDGGENWSLSFIGPSDDDVYDIQYQNGLIIAVSSKQVFKSVDYGENWDSVYVPPAEYRNVYFASDSLIYITGNHSALLKSSDRGLSFDKIDITWIEESVLSISLADSLSAFISSSYQPSKIFRTTDGGASFNEITPPGQGEIHKIFAVNSSSAVAASDIKILTTKDAGNNWTISSYGPTNYHVPSDFYFKDSLNGLAGCYWNLIRETTDGGITWNNRILGTNQEHIDNFSFPEPDYGFYQASNKLYNTTNFGLNWSLVRDIETGRIVFIDRNTGIAAQGNSISRTTDGGQTWLEGAHIDIIVDYDIKKNGSGSTLMVMSFDSLYTSFDLGISYTVEVIPFDDLRTITMIDPSKAWLTGFYGKIVKYHNTSITLGFKGEVQPNDYILFQNYPNPFNPSTKISWQSPAGSHQTIKVFDVLGREVATLVDEYRNAGYHEVEFNAAHLASGIYYYQLKAGDFIETKKMIYLK